MKRKAIIVDLDGTLYNTDHRQHLVDAKKWKEFYEAMADDTVNEWCANLIHGFRIDYTVILVTGRPAEYDGITRNCLMDDAVYFDKLLMRPTGDYRQDAVVKAEIYKDRIEPYYDVLFCVDDRQQVVDMWRSLGLVCLQCAKGDF